MSNPLGIPQHGAKRITRGAARQAVCVLMAFAASLAALLTSPVAHAGAAIVTITSVRAAQAANDQFLGEQAPVLVTLPDN